MPAARNNAIRFKTFSGSSKVASIGKPWPENLYDWAMRATNTLTAGTDRALYIGELPATGWHRHAAPVLLVGLSGRFAVHLAHRRSEHCRSALIDMGVEHVFDPCGERVALLYLEPDAPEALRLRDAFRRHGRVIFDPAMPAATRGCERALQDFDFDTLLRLPYHEGSARTLDERVQRSLQPLRGPRLAPARRGEMADHIGLSPSRFNHLFREQMGVSFRDYRVWSQVRTAMLNFRPDGSLTEAALDGAFSDSAHFSRVFRETFGMTPSSVLKPLREVRVLR